MIWNIAKIIIASIVIAFASWLSGRRPVLAGFIIALPLTSLLALAFGHLEYQDTAKSVAFARSILIAVPLSLSFFLPFLFADRFSLPFWGLYVLGILLLVIGFAVHQLVLK